jgi:hypothetical protein
MAATPTVAADSRSSSVAGREAVCAAGRAAATAAVSAVVCGEPGAGSSAATSRMPELQLQLLSPLFVFFSLSYITSKKKKL